MTNMLIMDGAIQKCLLDEDFVVERHILLKARLNKV
jgi:hypothetical protein